jgi:hypothetical protein
MSLDLDFNFSDFGGSNSVSDFANQPLPGLGGGPLSDAMPYSDFQPSAFNFAPDLSSVNASDYSDYFNTPINPVNPTGAPLPGLGGGKMPDLGEPTSDRSIADKGLSALKGFGSDVLGMIKANPIMALSLGMAGYGALKGPQTPAAVGDLRKSTGQTLDYMKGRTAGVDKLTQGLTDKYSSGKIDPVDERRIAQWTMQQKAQIENYYTKAGMPDSTAKINALKEIDAQALALTDQARQGYLQEAFKGMTLQAQATGQIASLQQSMNQTIAQLQQSGDVQAAQALQNLMYQTGMFASQSRGTTQLNTTLTPAE